MSRFLTKLRVYANPWRLLDSVGRPCLAVPWDPTHNPDRGWVGASIDPERTKIISTPAEGENRNPRQVTVFKFDEDVIELPLKNAQGHVHEHYLRAIQDGDLVPADPETAKRAGVKFRDPEEVLAATKRESIAKFDKDYGDGSWKSLKELRDPPPPPPPPPAPEAPKTEGKE